MSFASSPRRALLPRESWPGGLRLPPPGRALAPPPEADDDTDTLTPTPDPSLADPVLVDPASGAESPTPGCPATRPGHHLIRPAHRQDR